MSPDGRRGRRRNPVEEPCPHGGTHVLEWPSQKWCARCRPAPAREGLERVRAHREDQRVERQIRAAMHDVAAGRHWSNAFDIEVAQASMALDRFVSLWLRAQDASSPILHLAQTSSSPRINTAVRQITEILDAAHAVATELSGLLTPPELPTDR